MSYLDQILKPRKRLATFEEFITGDEFCGQKGVIYQFWLDELEGCADLPAYIFDGGIGTGKTTLANYLSAYRIYELFEGEEDFRKKCNLQPDTIVYFLYMSINLTTAKRTGYSQLLEIIDGCRWFSNHYPRDKNITSMIVFPNNFVVCYGSTVNHQIGMAVWGFMLDEANFRDEKGQALDEYGNATDLYDSLRNRQVSRFMTDGGKMNVLSVLISSASFKSSFTEAQKELQKNDPNSKIITAVGYKVKPDAYSKEKFEVFCGLGELEPTVVKDQEHRGRILKGINMHGLDSETQDALFEKVPVSLRSYYDNNLMKALQDHSGRATQPVGRFVRNMATIFQSYDDTLRGPFVSDKITLSNKDDNTLMQYLDQSLLTNVDNEHSLFLDLSVTGDSGGLTCVRNDNGVGIHIFTVEIVPPPSPAETRISKIGQFIVQLAGVINIVAFGSDQYQSKQLRQDINCELGLDDIRISIDSSDSFHLFWLRMVVDGMARMQNIPKLHGEIEGALHDLKRRRVVKEKNGTDDLFQSLVGAFFCLFVHAKSETGGMGGGLSDVSELYKYNYTSARRINKMIKKLGYDG